MQSSFANGFVNNRNLVKFLMTRRSYSFFTGLKCYEANVFSDISDAVEPVLDRAIEVGQVHGNAGIAGTATDERKNVKGHSRME